MEPQNPLWGEGTHQEVWVWALVHPEISMKHQKFWMKMAKMTGVCTLIYWGFAWICTFQKTEMGFDIIFQNQRGKP